MRTTLLLLLTINAFLVGCDGGFTMKYDGRTKLEVEAGKPQSNPQPKPQRPDEPPGQGKDTQTNSRTETRVGRLERKSERMEEFIQDNARFAIQAKATRFLSEAEDYVDQLNLKGIDAYLTKTTRWDGDWFRVRVGRFATRAAAEEKKAWLYRQGLVEEAIVTRYDPPS